jgi:regulatory protein
LAGPTPFQSLVRLLSARERTAADLRARLARKGFPPLAIEASLERAVALGYVDDRRTALAKASKLFARGLPQAAIRDRLREAGVGAVTLDEVMSEAPSEIDLARTAMTRRFRSRLPPAERVARYLAGKGFEPDLVEEALRGVPR